MKNTTIISAPATTFQRTHAESANAIMESNKIQIMETTNVLHASQAFRTNQSQPSKLPCNPYSITPGIQVM